VLVATVEVLLPPQVEVVHDLVVFEDVFVGLVVEVLKVVLRLVAEDQNVELALKSTLVVEPGTLQS
jgi:hypothetical protein